MGRREYQNEDYWAAVMAGTWRWSLEIPSSQKPTEASKYWKIIGVLGIQ